MVARTLVAVAVLATVTACMGTSTPAAGPSSVAPSRTGSATTPGSGAPTPTPASSTPSPAVPAITFRAAAAMVTVRKLAGGIGARETTTPAFRAAARWVEGRFTALGYDVERQELDVPGGVSWGVPVKAGTTWNVVARPAGLQLGDPYRLVGAHLDTVPQAPGAEDNASGIAVLLETARLAAAATPRLPVVFVAFAAEEPRGVGERRHHFGSRAMVAGMPAQALRSVADMVALDRVGVGTAVPICFGGRGEPTTAQAVRKAARSLAVPTRDCGANRSSDHWSFEKAGVPAARIGSTPYAAYHSARDVPTVVAPAQLGRVGRVLWAWLQR